jgi:hypothetical protein
MAAMMMPTAITQNARVFPRNLAMVTTPYDGPIDKIIFTLRADPNVTDPATHQIRLVGRGSHEATENAAGIGLAHRIANTLVVDPEAGVIHPL